jgi:hypothetical protein
MPSVSTSNYCFAHDPASARARAASRKKGGRNRRTPDGELPDGVTLRSVNTIQQVLEQVVGVTLKQSNSARRSRTLGYLLGIALRALEVGELEDRITALEARLSGTGRRLNGARATAPAA